MLFWKKQVPEPMHVDSRLNKWRPTISYSKDQQWQLSVEIAEGTILDFKIKGSTFVVIVTIDNAVYNIGHKQFDEFGKKYDLPIREVVVALIERWRFLKLIVELN